jgi:hypothetical protein
MKERESMLRANLGTNTIHTIKENEWMQLAQRADK